MKKGLGNGHFMEYFDLKPRREPWVLCWVLWEAAGEFFLEDLGGCCVRVYRREQEWKQEKREGNARSSLGSRRLSLEQ